MSRYWPLIKIVPIQTNLKFVSFAKFAAAISVIAVVGSIFLTVYPAKTACGGLNCGVDFKGGTQMRVSTAPAKLDRGKVSEILGSMKLGDINVQPIGGETDALLSFETPENVNASTTASRVQQALTAELGPTAKFTETESVSGKVSGELLRSGGFALGLAVLLMMAYIWFRFEWQFALGAVAGLLHDTILVFGFFAVTQLEFTLTAVAAILTVIGYSMNDTVVVFDRLRENLRKYKRMPLRDVIDLTVNETLSRTIITGITAIMALAILAVLGGDALRPFAISLIFGIVFGTYSSIYVGAPIILLWGVKRGEEVIQPLKPATR
jgi:preprotein translocase subunit SecF/SecD/SecF fusion protein